MSTPLFRMLSTPLNRLGSDTQKSKGKFPSWWRDSGDVERNSPVTFLTGPRLKGTEGPVVVVGVIIRFGEERKSGVCLRMSRESVGK